MMKKLLFWIGAYILFDGIISFIYFRDTATQTEQLFRIIRAILGGILIRWE